MEEKIFPSIFRIIVDLLLLPQDIISAFGPIRRVNASPFELIQPRTFNGQIAKWKFTNRRMSIQKIVDKLAVREFVADRIGKQYLAHLYWSGSQLSNDDLFKLPKRFAFKSNHASGHVLLVLDKEATSRENLMEVGHKWLSEDYGAITGEWQYRWIKPNLIAEEYLGDERGCPPIDYKMWIFNGKFGFLQVDYDRFSNHTRTFYNGKLEVLPFSILYPNEFRSLKAPVCWSELVGLAEALGRGLKFARIDFYVLDGGRRPIFGEITLSPGNGGEAFDPPEWDRIVWQHYMQS